MKGERRYKMSKGLILASVLLLAFALVFVSAENRDGTGPNESRNFSGKGVGLGNGSGNPALGFHEIRGFGNGINKMKNEQGDDMEVEKNGGLKLRIRNMTAHSDLNITPEDDNETNRTILRVHFPNGMVGRIKIMPDTASERALERLRLKVCNETNNCTIQLKETGKGNETKVVYDVQMDRHFKLLGMFTTKAHVRAEVDAESGNVTSVGKPWWSFLASEKEE